MTRQEHIDQLMLQYNIRRIDAKELFRLAFHKEEAIKMITNENSGVSLAFGQPVFYMPFDDMDDDRNYFTALHEIGHVALGHKEKGKLTGLRLVETEQEAWEWAFDNALDTEGFAPIMMDGLGTYWDYYNKQEESHFFSWLLERLGK